MWVPGEVGSLKESATRMERQLIGARRLIPSLCTTHLTNLLGSNIGNSEQANFPSPHLLDERWGLPFTGGSGLLLDEAFEKAGTEKKDIYITNVVKCHPPNNRKSLPHEIKNCVAYLNKELEWLDPSYIICLGKDAAAVFDDTTGVPAVRTAEKTKIHYLYHPSYIKRKPKSEQAAYIVSMESIIIESGNSE